MKTCSACAQEKPLDEFRNNRRTKDGKHSRCRPCHSAAEHDRYHNGPGRDRVLRRKYGLSLAEWTARLEAAGHRCECCGDPFPDASSVRVDHDHATGHVRGLLCHSCNVALGYLRDSPERAIAAAAYLQRSTP